MSGEGTSRMFSSDSSMDASSVQGQIKFTPVEPFYFESMNETELYKKSGNHNFSVTENAYFSPELIAFGGMWMIIIATFAIIGNLISILALCKSKRLRKVTTAFIVNLCIANMFLSTFSLVSSVIIYRTRHWNGGDESCKFYNIVMYFFTIMSMFTVTTITLNRYVLIVHSEIYHSLFRMRNTSIIITFLWILPLVFTVLPLSKVWGMFGYDPKTGECAIIDRNGNSRIYVFIIAYFIPLILFILCYTKILFVVRKAKKNTRENDNTHSCIACFRGKFWLQDSNEESPVSSYKYLRSEKEFRLFQMILVIFAFYVACFIPLAVMKTLQKEKELPTLYILCHLGIHLSNLVNPVIYVVMSKEYRKAYKELFC